MSFAYTPEGRILSGALHYFRVHPGQWADRIRKARQMGLNTIETYVAWNAHEPRRGEWDATGWNDLGAFLDLVAAEGMHAIVRPGPYICAEWHNGGLPVWLTGMPGIGLRRSEPQYLAEVTAYLERVYDIVAPRQIDRGGPVILVQIENEYGRTIEAYRNTLEIEGKEITVDVLRFGRIALVYQSLDESQTGMWDQNERKWVPLDSSYRSSIRQGLRIARKQAAPDVVQLPLPAPSAPRGEG